MGKSNWAKTKTKIEYIGESVGQPYKLYTHLDDWRRERKNMRDLTGIYWPRQTYDTRTEVVVSLKEGTDA